MNKEKKHQTLALLLQPRERLAAVGVAQLSLQELLTIILRSGNRQQPVADLATAILAHFPDLTSFKSATLAELKQIKGVGDVRAMEIQAVIEFGRRLQNKPASSKDYIHSSQQLGQRLVQEMQDVSQEHFMVIYLTTKNEIITEETIFVGSLNQSIAHPREIFYRALRHLAASIILVHNHPSGNPTPSTTDVELTERLVRCGELLGIAVLDHFIIGRTDYISLREAGMIASAN